MTSSGVRRPATSPRAIGSMKMRAPHDRVTAVPSSTAAGRPSAEKAMAAA